MNRPLSLLLILSLGLGFAASRCRPPLTTPLLSQKSLGKLQVLYTRDVMGNAELCGCSPDQKGGLPKMATVLRQHSRTDTPTIIVDCGNFLPKADDPVAPIYAPQIISGYRALSYDAINIGSIEAGHNLDGLLKLRQSGLPLISASLYDSKGKLLFEPLRVISRGGFKTAWIGLLAQPFSGAGVQGLSPEEALQRIQPLLAKDRFDLIGILGEFSVDEALAVAKVAPQAHLIISARDLQFAPNTPAIIAPATGRHGSHLGQARLQRRGEAFEFESDLISLSKEVGNDPGIAHLVEEAGEKARRALTITPQRRAPLGNFAGSDECLTCHSRPYEIWKAGKHSHAFDILIEKKADTRIDCVSCHVTGYQTRDAAYFAPHVGCESCHGPGKNHIDYWMSNKGQSVSMRAGKISCLKCHTELNSPLFTFDYYWSKIKH